MPPDLGPRQALAGGRYGYYALVASRGVLDEAQEAFDVDCRLSNPYRPERLVYQDGDLLFTELDELLRELDYERGEVALSIPGMLAASPSLVATLSMSVYGR